MTPLGVAAIGLFEALEPMVQEALLKTMQNVQNHDDPLSAAETAVICTASRAGSIEIIKAALRLKRKAKR